MTTNNCFKKSMLLKFSYLFVLVALLFNSGCKATPEPTATTTSTTTPSLAIPNHQNWLFADSGPITSGGDNMEPNAVVFNSKLYLARQEHENGSSKIRVSVLTANQWTSVDGANNALNFDTSRDAMSPQLMVFNNQLYIFWTEISPTVLATHGKVYNGNDSSPAWTSIDGNTFGLLYNTGSPDHVFFPQASVHNSKLYLTFHYANLVRVSVYNGSSSSPAWNYVDAGGLNYSTADFTGNSQSKLLSANGKLYAFWSESGSPCCTDQIRAKVFNGNDISPSWSFIDGGGISGLNRNSNHQANGPRTIVFNSKIYLMWYESDQIHTSVYNGNDTTPSWMSLDSNGSYGLNVNSSITTPQLVSSSDGFLYATWTESSYSAIRVAKYNGVDTQPVWTLIDEDPVHGLMPNPNTFVGLGFIVEFNAHLYAIWPEAAASGADHDIIRIAKKK